MVSHPLEPSQLRLSMSFYRGHNELDEPAFTQPQMYQKIRNRKSVPKLYEDKLIVRRSEPYDYITDPSLQSDSVITEADVDALRTSYKSHLESHLSQVESFVPKADMLQAQWTGIVWPGDKNADHQPKTGLPREELMDIGKASVAVPEGFVSLTSACVKRVPYATGIRNFTPGYRGMSSIV